MEIRYLDQFIAIEESQSLREAAEMLFVSQSTLSQNLKKLEEELGCQLFDRSRKQLKLNVYGKIMLRHSQRIIQELEEAKSEIEEEKLREAQNINIGVYAYAFASFVMPNLANAMKDNVLECHILDDTHLYEKLLDNELDIIITSRNENNNDLVSTRLFQEQILISLPSSSPYASKQSIFFRDLDNLELYWVTDASGYTPWFEQALRSAGIDTLPKNTAPFKEYLYSRDNNEYCHMTSSFIERFLPNSVRRVLLPLSEDMCTRNIYMVYKKSNKKALSQLLTYIDEYQDRLFSGSAFLPYFLFPSTQETLHFYDDTE